MAFLDSSRFAVLGRSDSQWRWKLLARVASLIFILFVLIFYIVSITISMALLFQILICVPIVLVVIVDAVAVFRALRSKATNPTLLLVFDLFLVLVLLFFAGASGLLSFMVEHTYNQRRKSIAQREQKCVEDPVYCEDYPLAPAQAELNKYATGRVMFPFQTTFLALLLFIRIALTVGDCIAIHRRRNAKARSRTDSVFGDEGFAKLADSA